MKVPMPPLPDGFKDEILAQFGKETGNRILESLNTPPSVSLRLNSRKVDIESASGEGTPYRAMTPIDWAEGGFRLADRPRFTNHPWLHGGGFYVQEGASMWISELMKRIVEAEGGRKLRVLDLCAAPGGKSIGAIEQLPDESLIISNEVNNQRARVLCENIIKWGYPGSIVSSGPASEFGKMRDFFDVAIVDAPCSGEGMMRKEEVARTQWSPRLVMQCASLQREILAGVLPALRPGGWLIYSTCAFNSIENEENVKWLATEMGLNPEGNPRRFTPADDGTEGLFMAMLRKPADDYPQYYDAPRYGKEDSRKKKSAKGSGSSKSDMGVIKEAKTWLLNGDEFEFSERNGSIIACTPEVKLGLSSLPPGIRILKSGVEVAEIKGKDLIPAHSLALSTALKRGMFPEVELSEVESLRYLARESISLPPDTPKGIIALKFKGLIIGWVKNLGPRSNNLYPKEWKIRSL